MFAYEPNRKTMSSFELSIDLVHPGLEEGDHELIVSSRKQTPALFSR